MKFDSVETALTHLKNGGYIIVSDNEDRENEGDLVALADRITGDGLRDAGRGQGLDVCAPDQGTGGPTGLHQDGGSQHRPERNALHDDRGWGLRSNRRHDRGVRL